MITDRSWKAQRLESLEAGKLIDKIRRWEGERLGRRGETFN